ncbi:MAG: transcriptional coactivator p15/PC4 family protein [Candidatus Omnitrophota bacterium]
MQKMVKSFQKNKFQEVRVSITEFRDNDLIDIRVWATKAGSDEKVPTPKGVTINISLFPELKEAILSLENELRANNLL